MFDYFSGITNFESSFKDTFKKKNLREFEHIKISEPKSNQITKLIQ